MGPPKLERLRFDELKTLVVPQLAESISEGDIRWEKAEGDSVEVDEVIGEIETDKTSVPINSPSSGVIQKLLVEDGSTVKPGQNIAEIKVGAGGSSAPKNETPKPKSDPQPQIAEKQAENASVPPPTQRPSVPPTPSAPIETKNVSNIPVSKASPETNIQFGSRSENRVKINRMRSRIAQRLKDAQNTYAMLTTFNEIDMSNAIEMRNLHKDAFLKKHNLKLGFMSTFVAASVFALKDQPVVNAVIDDQEIIYRDYVDISVAVATPKGLVVPVLRNCENMNYAQIEKAIAQLGEKAKTNSLAIEDMDGGTFTISNGGVFGSLMGTPIINPPQSAILGMHSIVERPVVVNKQIVIRPMMYVALTYDHRLIDGREAVTFLRKIKAAVEDPRIMHLDV
ncbi:hypothetical protein RND71_044246 [Anisodus tanguticus]|uniref:dihydrolipoyllysine-residue succinyltransferase n=1 Tax=Anisodus tanguticus TaxID=243964 RepID=A0AAE1QMY0_9SOLA|nr:hypothetical protein RND71_044246 [Anisodus tanguticus]